jgi:hypothetical protein
MYTTPTYPRRRSTPNGRRIHAGGGVLVSKISKSAKTLLSRCVEMADQAVREVKRNESHFV